MVGVGAGAVVAGRFGGKWPGPEPDVEQLRHEQKRTSRSSGAIQAWTRAVLLGLDQKPKALQVSGNHGAVMFEFIVGELELADREQHFAALRMG